MAELVKSELCSVIGLAASAGGLAALSKLLSALPADFAAPITLVLHLSPGHPSFLAKILNRQSPLIILPVEPGEFLRPGHVYVAPPNHHLLVNADGSLALDKSKAIHYVRPSANRLFESLAESFGERVIAVVLTGSGRDGREGVLAVKHSGGRVIAQDQATSDHFGMPSEAIATGSVDWVLPLEEIAPTLVRLVNDAKEKLEKREE